MTEIKYDPIALSLTVRGHAGYAEAGRDIVCAGVSALFYAIPTTLREKGFKCYADADEREGFATVRAFPAAEERHSCFMIFETVVAGMKALASNYPDYVHVDKEESKWV